jgi:hypothetical protein
MNRRIAFPFLTLSDAAVETSAWEVSLNGVDWAEAGEFLPHWDQSCDIHIRRKIRLASDIAAADLSLSRDDLRLSLGVRIGTGQGRLPRLIVERCRHSVTWDDPVWQFERVVPGQVLSIVVDLQTEVTLAAPPRSPAQLTPRHVGNRLWSDSLRLRLEGEEPRFPIETADLGRLLGDGIAGAAPWHLHWSPRDWDRDFHGAVRLYLNENASEFLERIENEDPPTLQVLLADVMSQVCERFLSDPEASELIDAAEPGSLGAQAATWLRKAWPGKDAAFIRSVLESRPGVFRSALLALAEPREA